ncbi:PAS domain-containing sensor histidine kinase [Rhizobium sp. TRM95111]|uniref:ATP-binding protein n=1 Tax=Rhizobium alarense TaxID=2846851 RepID=UPI001F33B57E|nr:ATP-binding protein [Rhizobium alarense]MCF3642957.1 PAS domain-containing sensor histidine kinase [Rhizobium alarense]
MPARQYPFIDVAVHDRVRRPFSRGQAVVLFSRDMTSVLWANGRGATLFDHASVYDLLEAGPPQDITFRQIEAASRQLAAPGDSRPLMLRLASGFRSQVNRATAELITLRSGEAAVLLSVEVAETSETMDQKAAALLAGLDDPDTHMAVLDADGAVIAASGAFEMLAVPDETRRMLAQAADLSADRLVKRPIATDRGLVPAAIGKISDAPAHYLLFAVETVLGHLDPAAEVRTDAPAEPDAAPALEAIGDGPSDAEMAEAREPDLSARDETALAPAEAREDIESGDGPAPADDIAGDAAASEPVETQPVDASADGPHLADRRDAPRGSVQRGAAAETALPFDREEGTDFRFDRGGRPVRFVWKIDADGRFSEISQEFSQAVGAGTASVIGEHFDDVARRHGFDRDGRIGELLSRRDTWSGKTILWPVEGSDLVVPVDLAALPTYSRTREFDGFRGFGIVRMADAIALPPAREDTAPDAADAAPTEDKEGPGSLPAEPAGGSAPSDEQPAVDRQAADIGEPSSEMPGDAFRGERPALRIVETPARRASDKVIQLERHRGRGNEGLTSGEQAAFREIARQLGGSFGRRDPDGEAGLEAGVPSSETATANNAVGRPEADDQSGNEPAEVTDGEGNATAIAQAAAEPDEMPGLEVGPHADDLPRGVQTAIAPPRSRMAYGLTATVVDALPVALLIHAGDRLIHANPEFLALSGYGDLAALEGAGGLDHLLETAGGTDEAPEGAMLMRAASGEAVPVHARLQSVRWESGTALILALNRLPSASDTVASAPEEASNVVVSPEEEQTAVSRLRMEANELRSILETATDGVVVVGQEGEIRSMNRSASALFNYDDEETRGKPFAMLFAHESQKAVLDYLAGLSGHGVASVLNDGREVIGRESSGGFIPLFMTLGRLASSSGYCAVIRDVTQWKRTEEDLRNAKRAAETANAHKTDFLARVSHEIRTPLNAIIGFSDMMATERFGPIGHPRYIEYANDIGRSGRHVLDIVNDLLDISKIEAGEMDLEFTAVGLNETVAEAVSLVQPQANSQRVIIRTSLANAVPPVVADLRSIKQIALNILSNAIRFTPSGGQIVVSTAYETNGSVVLRIRDTGIGMTRSELELAMKPFRQVTAGARKRGDGTGLGLPLTKAMVDANRATFAITSSPNEGTLVEVVFPSPRVLAD